MSKMDETARELLNANRSKIPNADKFLHLLDDPATKAMLNAIPGEESLRKTAAKAARGDAEATRKLIARVLSSKEGRELVGKIKGGK